VIVSSAYIFCLTKHDVVVHCVMVEHGMSMEVGGACDWRNFRCMHTCDGSASKDSMS
jgi:hypothetical protein